MKNVLILIIALCISAGKLTAQHKVLYTITLDTTKAVNAFTTSDNKNFYITREWFGDYMAERAWNYDDLLVRSSVLSNIYQEVDDMEELYYKTIRQKNNQIHALTQERDFAIEKADMQEILRMDQEDKATFWHKQYKRQKLMKVFGMVGVGATVAGTTYIICRAGKL